MTKKLTSIRLSPDAIAQMDEAARRWGVSRSRVIEAAIYAFLDVATETKELRYSPDWQHRYLRKTSEVDNAD